MQGIRRLGYEAVVALARPSDVMAKLFEDEGFRVFRCSQFVLLDHSTVARQPWYNPLTYIKLLKVVIGWKRTKQLTMELVRRLRPDLVHLNSMPLSACAAALADAGVPFVWHVREPPPDDSFRTRFIRQRLMRATELIFLSHFDKRCWVNDRCGVVINNFVDLNEFQPTIEKRSARLALGIKPDVPVILYVGGTQKAKGGVELLKALALLLHDVPNVVCIAPGAELEKPQSLLGYIVRKLPFVGRRLSPSLNFQRTLMELGLSDNVISKSFSSNVVALYAAADILVFPAVSPHFARPVIEAAAMGLPSIGSRLGGIDELIEDGKTGLLVKPNDPSAIAEALSKIIADEKQKNVMGINARQLAEKRFGLEIQIQHIMAVYNKI